jgi:hypothetical protein
MSSLPFWICLLPLYKFSLTLCNYQWLFLIVWELNCYYTIRRMALLIYFKFSDLFSGYLQMTVKCHFILVWYLNHANLLSWYFQTLVMPVNLLSLFVTSVWVSFLLPLSMDLWTYQELPDLYQKLNLLSSPPTTTTTTTTTTTATHYMNQHIYL